MIDTPMLLVEVYEYVHQNSNRSAVYHDVLLFYMVIKMKVSIHGAYSNHI